MSTLEVCDLCRWEERFWKGLSRLNQERGNLRLRFQSDLQQNSKECELLRLPVNPSNNCWLARTTELNITTKKELSVTGSTIIYVDTYLHDVAQACKMM